jgi:outer membrane receptor protein involved in Fe transport
MEVPVFEIGFNSYVSTINFIDFSPTYLGRGNPGDNLRLLNSGTGINRGLDLSLQKYITDDFFFLLAGSLYRSENKMNFPNWTKRNAWSSTRFDGRHTLNLTAGREFAKQKNGKTIINGISSRVAWLGGFREPLIDLVASKEVGYTVYQKTEISTIQTVAYSEKLDDYFRIDLRLYKKWNKVGRNSMLSLDIQNLTNRKNDQYHYYDSVQDKVLLKSQLGLIPILTWRGEF